ncbi:MAG TPA: response regulator [Gemmatimonadaceae bacterium]|nr:response regulator [Gemmatimonadaceae bacterium]
MPTPAVEKSKAASVLVVDDDAMMRELLVRVLKDHATLETCESGADALARLSSKAYDVVLLDIGLPDISGLEVLRQKAPVASNSRFLIITADDTPDTVIEAVRGQAYGYLRKPFTPDELRMAFEECLAATADPAIEVVSARPDWFELSLPCTRSAANRIDNFMQQLELELAPDVRDTVAQAFRELLMNAVEWGGGFDPSRRVRVACLRTARILFYRIADPGPGFHFKELTHAAVSHPDDPIAHMSVREEKGIRPGGLGLVMVKAFADELLYNEKQNEVVFIKYL